MTFAIVGRAQHPSGCWHFNARAKHEGAVVGFEVVLGADWKEGGIDLGDGERLPTYRGVVDYRSTGEESNRLAVSFGSLYDVSSAGRMSPADAVHCDFAWR